MPLPPSITRAACLTAGLGLLLVTIPTRGSGQQPAPTVPTIPAPAPRTTPVGYTVQAPAAVPPAQPEAPKGPNGTPEVAVTLPELSLGECIAIALERQPSLKAVRASQQATQTGLRALNNIGRVGQLLSQDLPVRKEQATRGVIAVSADVQKTHNEIIQDATRLYYTVVYARQQEAITEDVVSQLDVLVKLAEDILNSKTPGTMTRVKLEVMRIGLAEARALRGTAQDGEKRAMAALREVMAVEPAFEFRVKDRELPVMGAREPLTKEAVIQMALCRRPEMALAAAGVDAFRLEVYAQSRLPFRRAVPTLASASDIHARQVPQGSRDKDYRPEAIAPEMPTQLVGTKMDRVSRAMAYSQRADAVYEKTHNLIALEAETTFYNLELAAWRLEQARVKFESGRWLANYVKENFAEAKAPDKDLLLQTYVLASKAQSDYVEAVYQHLLALAALERVTAGGVQPPFPGR